MAHLFQLSTDFNQLLALLEEGETDYPEEVLWDTIEAVECELRDKAVNIACVIKSLKSDVEGFKAEEQRLAARRKTIENSIEGLKAYAERELQSAGVTAIKDDPRAQISFRKTKSVSISDEYKFLDWAQDHHRDDLLNYKVSVSKTAIKQSLDTGAEIPFCSIEEKNSMIIK